MSDRQLYAAMMKKMGWMTKVVKSSTDSSSTAEEVRTAEIICKAKQAIENFKSGSAEVQTLDSFIQSLV